MNARADRFRTITDGAVDEARDVATQTARQLDAGEYGIDAWSKSMVQFFDIVARGSAAHFRTAIAGPCGSPGSHDQIPAAEEEIPLDEVRDWPRKVSIDSPFKDVVRPEVVIPASAVILTPTIVPAKSLRFILKVRLTDTRYLGRNYTARLALAPTGGLSDMQIVDRQVVTVAL